MHVENVSKKTVHLFTKHKQKNHVNFGHKLDIVVKEKTVNFTTLQKNKKRKIKHSWKKTKIKHNKRYKGILLERGKMMRTMK